jgi:KaiC/GvpD/RAD55 family RecA-like ATPase
MSIATGIQGFDELIEGGFPKERTSILTGPAGSDKTTFGIQYLPKDMDQLINVFHRAGTDSSVFESMREFNKKL